MKTTAQVMNCFKSISVMLIFSLIVFTIYSIDKKVWSTIHGKVKAKQTTLNNASIEK